MKHLQRVTVAPASTNQPTQLSLVWFRKEF